MENCKIITISNQKGGVGKTTTTCNLGNALANMGHRALLADFDPQANFTMSFCIERPDQLAVSMHGVLALIMDSKALPDKAEYIRHSGKPTSSPAISTFPP